MIEEKGSGVEVKDKDSENAIKVEKVTINNVNLKEFLKEEFLKKLEELGKSFESEVNPVAFVLFSELKGKENKLDPIIMIHNTKEDFTDKKISIECSNENIIKKLAELLSG